MEELILLLKKTYRTVCGNRRLFWLLEECVWIVNTDRSEKYRGDDLIDALKILVEE